MYSGTFKSFHGKINSLAEQAKQAKDFISIKLPRERRSNDCSLWIKYVLSATYKEGFLHGWYHTSKVNSEYKNTAQGIANAMQAMQSKLCWKLPPVISHKCQLPTGNLTKMCSFPVSRTTLEGPNERHLNWRILSKTHALVLFRLPFEGVVLVFQTWRTQLGNTTFSSVVCCLFRLKVKMNNNTLL